MVEHETNRFSRLDVFPENKRFVVVDFNVELFLVETIDRDGRLKVEAILLPYDMYMCLAEAAITSSVVRRPVRALFAIVVDVARLLALLADCGGDLSPSSGWHDWC